MDPILLRFIERCFIALVAGFCLYMGYRLLGSPARPDQSATITLPGGFRLDLRRVAPGVFFAALGAVVLVTLTFNELIKESDGRITYYYQGAKDYQSEPLRRTIKTLNSIETFILQAEPFLEDKENREVALAILSERGLQELEMVIENKDEIAHVKRHLLAPFFPNEDLAIWEGFGDRFESQQLEPDRLQRLRQIEGLMTQRLRNDAQ